MKKTIDRRIALKMLASSGLLLGGCGRLDSTSTATALLKGSDALGFDLQRLLLSSRPLVREFAKSQISEKFPTNGTTLPKGEHYQQLVADNFSNWKLKVDGLVENKLALSLNDIRSLPQRTQITMHNCDEGWGAIGQWSGPQLSTILAMAVPKASSRYVVFHCLDTMEANGIPYYESIDLIDAVHPQTILAHRMHDQSLPVPHGAPLRLRVELQIGYKNAKYVDRIELTDRLDHLGGGKGGWWEDFDNAPWYAGQ